VDKFDGAVVGRTVYTEKRVPIVDTITEKLKKAIDFEGEDTRVRSKLHLERRDQNKTSYISIKSRTFKKIDKIAFMCVVVNFV
jgi:hypothetical protein